MGWSWANQDKWPLGFYESTVTDKQYALNSMGRTGSRLS